MPWARSCPRTREGLARFKSIASLECVAGAECPSRTGPGPQARVPVVALRSTTATRWLSTPRLTRGDRVKGIDPEAFLRLVRGQIRGPAAAVARLGLGAVSGLYCLGVSARNAAYDWGWKTAHRAAVPVVSVGNLTLGGTGKTPMVEWVARWFRGRGARVAILSRGYGQAEGLNDEGRVLEENLPDVPHFQGADRVELARIAVEESESQVLVLDDGFQHRRLARDLDIVLLDALEPFGLGRLFPRGLLREPVSSLRRAGLVVLSRADLVPGPTRRDI